MSAIVSERMTVPFVDFKRRYALCRDEILKAVDAVFLSGTYILGEAVEQLEEQLSQYLDCPYVVAVANGTDSIILSLKVLQIGPDDEVIVPVNSFIASAGAVVAVGAKPVFCDVARDLNIDVSQIEKHITKKTKAIMPVHLTGRPANMPAIMDIAKKYSLHVIEDAAQSIGAKINGKMTGTIGDFGSFSLHPLKNLHAYGDGGIITTHSKEHYHQLKILRNHGLINRDMCQTWGFNSRLDSMQAKIVSVGLRYLNNWNLQRQKNAAFYQTHLKDLVIVPYDAAGIHSVYHNFVILTKKRDALADFLKKNNIDTRIHYPVPLHLQPAANSLGYKKGDYPVAEQLASEMLSLPIYPELTAEQINYIVFQIKEFFNGN